MALHRAGSVSDLLSRPGRILGSRLMGSLAEPTAVTRRPTAFPVRDHVEVSIIIPVFNHCQDTLSCLESIARLTTGTRLRGHRGR